MKVILSIIIVISFKTEYIKTIHNAQESSIYSHAEILKQLVKQEIKQEQAVFLEGMPVEEAGDRSDEFDWNRKKRERITPIMHIDPNKFKPREEVVGYTTTNSATSKSTTKTITEVSKALVKPLRSNIKKKKKKKNDRSEREPAEIFYRRELDHTLNYPVKEIHCCDLLSPYLMGEKGNGTFKIIKATDRVVLRVIQLISEEIPKDAHDEVLSIMYQLNNIKIRLYQWDQEALALLFNQIIPGRKHNFRHLKRGIKNLFIRWNLFYSNMTYLMEQTRIFRPPCIQTSEITGSTKTSKAIRYPKLTTPKKICIPAEDDDCV